MQDLCMHDSIDAFFKRNPSADRVFDSLGIDYCCGGARTLEEACLAGGHDPETVVRLLGEPGTAVRDAALDTRRAGLRAILGQAGEEE